MSAAGPTFFGEFGERRYERCTAAYEVASLGSRQWLRPV